MFPFPEDALHAARMSDDTAAIALAALLREDLDEPARNRIRRALQNPRSALVISALWSEAKAWDATIADLVDLLERWADGVTDTDAPSPEPGLAVRDLAFALNTLLLFSRGWRARTNAMFGYVVLEFPSGRSTTLAPSEARRFLAWLCDGKWRERSVHPGDVPDDYRRVGAQRVRTWLPTAMASSARPPVLVPADLLRLADRLSGEEAELAANLRGLAERGVGLWPVEGACTHVGAWYADRESGDAFCGACHADITPLAQRVVAGVLQASPDGILAWLRQANPAQIDRLVTLVGLTQGRGGRDERLGPLFDAILEATRGRSHTTTWVGVSWRKGDTVEVETDDGWKLGHVEAVRWDDVEGVHLRMGEAWYPVAKIRAVTT